MGTFAGHIVPGAAFSLLGLWHTLNAISSHKLSTLNADFQSQTWYPLSGRLSLFRHLELLLLLSFSLFAMATQLLSHSSDGFEHATIFLHLAVYSGAAITADKIHPQSEVLRGLINLQASNVFAQELFLLHFHSTDHTGIEGHYHWLLQLIVFVCLISSLASTMAPSCFPAALLRSMAVTLQGSWFSIMAFSLWVPRLIATGCNPSGSSGDGGSHGAVVCSTVEADAWARVLANLQFSWAVGGVSILTMCLCLVKGKETTEYRRLVSGAVDLQHLNSAKEDLKQVGV